MYSFETRTGRVSIDHSRCDGCKTLACVKACSLYGAGILRVEKGKPVLSVSLDEAKRRDNECLACEMDCHFHGQRAIVISLPIEGLSELRRTDHGHSAE
jgi:Fe-S-cluster-containing hydrogenase component 2